MQVTVPSWMRREGAASLWRQPGSASRSRPSATKVREPERTTSVRRRDGHGSCLFGKCARPDVDTAAAWLGVSDALIGEEDDVALGGPGLDEAHRLLVAGLTEEALAGPEHDREDLQPQLVDQVVLHQRVYELEAGGDDDFPVELLLQLRDLVLHVALEDRRVVPVRILEGRGHDVLGQAVQPVRQFASP